MLGPLTTILGGWWVGGGWWVLDFARIKLTQPSLAGAGAELGNMFRTKLEITNMTSHILWHCLGSVWPMKAHTTSNEYFVSMLELHHKAAHVLEQPPVVVLILKFNIKKMKSSAKSEVLANLDYMLYMTIVWNKNIIVFLGWLEIFGLIWRMQLNFNQAIFCCISAFQRCQLKQ